MLGRRGILGLVAMTERTDAKGVEQLYLLAFEGFVAVMVVLFLINFCLGWRKNEKLAKVAATVLHRHLEPQFAHLGVDQKGTALWRESAVDFLYYASGRRFTSGLTATFRFYNRADLLALMHGVIAGFEKDICTISLPLLDGFRMEPISMFLARKKELQRLRNSGDRIAKIVKTIETSAGDVNEQSFLGNEYLVISEHPDVVTALLPSFVQNSMKSMGNSLLSLHVTDQDAGWDQQSPSTRRLVRLVFEIPGEQSFELYEHLFGQALLIALWLVDACATVRISNNARARAIDLRRQAAQREERLRMKERQEEAEKRRIEKRKNQEEAVAKLSAEKQAKYEEKKRKRELRARTRPKKL